MRIGISLIMASALVWVGACAADPGPPEQDAPDAEQPERRTKIGKADLWGSCDADSGNDCGGKSEGNCWCDAACSEYEDCCEDYDLVCELPGECSPVLCQLYCPYGFNTDANGCAICSCAPAPDAAPSCEGHCGGPADGKACYCDEQCESFGDCCDDYADHCGDDRTPASGQCVKNSNDACTTDADCVAGGCGGELCYNPALGGGFSTCECSTPNNVAGCGCVDNKCTWYN